MNYVESIKRAERGIKLTRPLLLPLWAANWAVWVVILTFFWNGLFFLQRVIDSHTTHRLRLQGASGKAAKDESKDD